MLKSKLMFAACCSIPILCGSPAISAPFPSYLITHDTHNNAGIELKPLSKTNSSYIVAAATFLPDWDEPFSGFNDSNVDFNEEKLTENRIFTKCILKGYNRTSCTSGYLPQNFCPDSELYFHSCKSTAEICREKGYADNCQNGYVKDNASLCPENSAYSKCMADPCEGFDYTLAEASADGYTITASCLSGTEEKYQRTESGCPGFTYDSSNCGNGPKCQILAGSTCRSGEILKYTECNACPVPQCELPQINLDTYYCEGALRCLIPQTPVL